MLTVLVWWRLNVNEYFCLDDKLVSFEIQKRITDPLFVFLDQELEDLFCLFAPNGLSYLIWRGVVHMVMCAYCFCGSHSRALLLFLNASFSYCCCVQCWRFCFPTLYPAAGWQSGRSVSEPGRTGSVLTRTFPSFSDDWRGKRSLLIRTPSGHSIPVRSSIDILPIITGKICAPQNCQSSIQNYMGFFFSWSGPFSRPVKTKAFRKCHFDRCYRERLCWNQIHRRALWLHWSSCEWVIS